MKLWRWLLPIASLSLVTTVTMWEMSSARTSPGPLHPAHQKVPALDGGNTCEACHESGSGVSVTACNKCHQPIGKQLQSKTGLHGGLPTQLQNSCATCHSEHHGAVTPLIAPHAFAKAGVADREHYDHKHVAEFTLVGAHASLACNKCHKAAEEKEPPPNGRFVGLQQGCTSCHEDHHKGAYGRDCESCHGQTAEFKQAPHFRHDAFLLKDAHQNRTCVSCHPATGEHSIEVLSRHAPPPRVCVECHQNPHVAEAAPDKARMRIRDSEDCSKCHKPSKFSSNAVNAAAHARFGFPLRGQHQQAKCDACHGEHGTKVRWTGSQPPEIEQCRACHSSPHRQELLAKDSGLQRECAECHRDADANFAKATVDAAQHARVGFPLAVPHNKVACDKCHTRAEAEYGKRYPGRAAKTCTGCHQDVHKGQFKDKAQYNQCTACHAETHFKPTGFDLAAHQKSAFPLLASHQAVTCERCHATVRDNVRVFTGTPMRCVLCHPDPHDGYFDRRGLPSTISGHTDCARCHDERGFARIAASFDHGMWTGWAQTGAHNLLDCAKCHAQLAKPDRNGSRFGKALGKDCTDCHRDPHLGQFAAEGPANARADCTRCHVTTRFQDVKFDHNKDSRFPLDQTHKKVECVRCHQQVNTPAGQVIRYKPLGMRCVDCHGTNKPKKETSR